MRHLSIGIVAALVWSAAASAQVTPHGGAKVVTDERRRGISWSDGDAALSAWGRLDLSGGVDIGVRATATRGDPRHGGADGVIEPTLGYSTTSGGLRLDGFVTGYLFTGAVQSMDYAEGGVGASYTLGPAEVGAVARYAPSQRAIGGDNLYLGLNGRVGVPTTPFSLTAAVGRSSGTTRNGGRDPRAMRLRPDGTYADWSFGAEYVMGPLTLGALYSDTDIRAGRERSPFQSLDHTGGKVTFRAGVDF